MTYRQFAQEDARVTQTVPFKESAKYANKDYDLMNPAHIQALLDQKPSHITEREWLIEVHKLKMMAEGKTPEETRFMLIGWLNGMGLLPGGLAEKIKEPTPAELLQFGSTAVVGSEISAPSAER